MLPEFTSAGELPAGVYVVTSEEFRARFGAGIPRRIWLSSRLDVLLDLADKTGKLLRVFVWGSFVTTKSAPQDIDILLVMAEDFELDQVAAPSRCSTPCGRS